MIFSNFLPKVSVLAQGNEMVRSASLQAETAFTDKAKCVQNNYCGLKREHSLRGNLGFSESSQS